MTPASRTRSIAKSLHRSSNRLQQRDQQRLDHAARADHPGGDAIDAGVEIIKPDVHPRKVIAAHDLFGVGATLGLGLEYESFINKFVGSGTFGDLARRTLYRVPVKASYIMRMQWDRKPS